MTIEQLNHFLTVAKFQNFTHAADSLYLHPSTMSKSISTLEQELGGPLFIRQKGALSLTASGRLLMNEAPAIIRRFTSLSERAKRLNNDTGGRLSMITISHFTCDLAEAYRRFSEDNPNVIWNVQSRQTYTSPQICDAVLNDHADIGMVPKGRLPLDLLDLRVLPFRRTHFSLAVPWSNPLSARDHLLLEDLSGQRMLINKTMQMEILMHMTSLLMGRGLAPFELTPVDNAPGASSSTEFLLTQVRAGYGIAFHYQESLLMDGSGYKVLDIADFGQKEAPFDIVLIYRDSNTNPVLHRFLEIVRQTNGY